MIGGGGEQPLKSKCAEISEFLCCSQRTRTTSRFSSPVSELHRGLVIFLGFCVNRSYRHPRRMHHLFFSWSSPSSLGIFGDICGYLVIFVFLTALISRRSQRSDRFCPFAGVNKSSPIQSHTSFHGSSLVFLWIFVDLCGSLFFLPLSSHCALIALIDLKKSLPYLSRQACPPFCALSSLNFFPCSRLVFFPPFAAASDKTPWNRTAPFSLIPIISSFVTRRLICPSSNCSYLFHRSVCGTATYSSSLINIFPYPILISDLCIWRSLFSHPASFLGVAGVVHKKSENSLSGSFYQLISIRLGAVGAV